MHGELIGFISRTEQGVVLKVMREYKGKRYFNSAHVYPSVDEAKKVAKKKRIRIVSDTTRKNPNRSYKTTQQVTNALRTLWSFTFRNVNKDTQASGPTQTITVAVKTISGGRYRKMNQMRDDAVRKFTAIVNTMYPRADQVVADYGPVKGRVFV